MAELLKHPDEVMGPEESMYRAGEEVWLDAIEAAREAGNETLARNICEQQFRRDPEGIVFVELNGERVDLGHVSVGFQKLTELINRP